MAELTTEEIDELQLTDAYKALREEFTHDQIVRFKAILDDFCGYCWDNGPYCCYDSSPYYGHD